MAVLLGLGQGILMDAGLAQNLGQGVGDHGRLNQIVGGDLQVAVVLQHTGKQHTGEISPVKLVKILPVEGQRDFLGPVAPEIEKDHAVAVGDPGHGSAGAGDDKGGQVLIDAAGLGAVGFNCLPGGSEHPAPALHMGAPAGFHHGPVGLIAVHGDLHTAAAGGDGVVAALGIQLRQDLLQPVHILQSGGGGHVTAVQQNMAVDLFGAFGVGLLQHGDQVGDVGVDVAVGQQTQEMQRLAGQGIVQQLLPGFALIERAVFDGLADQLGALGIDLAAAKGIVAHLAVAHVIVGGQADGGAVGLQPGVGAGFQQMIQSGGFGVLHGIAAAAVALAHTVHNYQYNGFLHDK